MDISELLRWCADPANNVSDIHLRTGKPAWVRINGQLTFFDTWGPVTKNEIDTFMLNALPGKTAEPDMDFLITGDVASGGRFRGNYLVSGGEPGIVMRALPTQIPKMHELGLPPKLTELLSRDSGLILVTGVTGSGKSTTIASMIQQICDEPYQHVITIEDPVEYQISSEKNLVTQRALGGDFKNFPAALRSAMREDPDIIMVGEIRDKETAELVLSAAETGHMVFSTLHTGSAPGTIGRLIGLMEGEGHEGVRTQIAGALIGVLSQTLIPKEGGGRVLAYEFMAVTDGIRNNIRLGKMQPIADAITSGRRDGMVSMSMCLNGLLENGTISEVTHQNTIAKLGLQVGGRQQ